MNAMTCRMPLPMAVSKRPIQRPSVRGETQKLIFEFDDSLAKRLRDFADENGEAYVAVARRAIEREISNAIIAADNPRSYRGKFLTKAPAGPWEEALEHAGSFSISEDTANELQVRDGDVFVRAVGESMDGAGIWDNAMLLMRPIGTRAPRRNDIVLVEVQTEDGEHFGTIKHWQPGTVPKLTDGEGNDFALPENTISVRAVAELQGIIALH